MGQRRRYWFCTSLPRKGSLNRTLLSFVYGHIVWAGATNFGMLIYQGDRKVVLRIDLIPKLGCPKFIWNSYVRSHRLTQSCQTFDNKPSGEEDFYWIDHTANAKGQGFSGLYFGGPFVCPNLYNICRPKLVGRTLWGEEYLDFLPVHHVVHAKMAGPRHPRRSF